MKNNYNPLLKLMALLEADVSIDENTNELIVKIPYENYLTYEYMWEKINNEEPKV